MRGWVHPSTKRKCLSHGVARANVCTGTTCCVKNTVSCLCTRPCLGPKPLSDPLGSPDLAPSSHITPARLDSDPRACVC